MLELCANFNCWNKQHGVGIFTLMKWLKSLSSSGKMKMLDFKKVSGSVKTYF